MIKRTLVVCGLALALAACSKPSEGDCKRAIANIRALLGTDKLTEDTGQTAAWVRSCRGSAKRESVKCAMEASTVEQLKRCGLITGEELDELMAPSPAPTTGAAPPTGAAPTTGAAPATGEAPATGLDPSNAPATGAAPPTPPRNP